MPTWTTACPDWERRIVAGESLVPCAPLFPEQVEKWLPIFRGLRIIDAPGSPMMGEACRPWFFDFVSAIIGAYDAESGRRLISEFFLLISKKNMKSTGAAGIMMTSLVWNWRLSAEFLIIAPTIEIANNSFFPARDMVRADDELSAKMQVQDHYRIITNLETNTTLKIVAADSEAVSGKKATGILVDELWLFGKRANAENMMLEATGGMASRPEGFTIYLSTQSDEPPAGVFKQKLSYARGVRDGRIVDKRFMPVLYEFPRAMLDRKEHLLPENRHITNPNLGASVDEQFLEDKHKQAMEGGAESMRGFLAKHLNVEIGLALAGDRWAGADFWEGCGNNALTLDTLLARSDVVVVGIDGGGLDDLLGLTVMGRDRDTRKWLHWAHAWAHTIVLERRKEIAPALKDFERAGELTMVELPGKDVDEVADICCRIHALGLFPEKNGIGVDPAGIGDIVDELTSEARGIPAELIVAVPQGWKLNGAIKTMERKLAGGEVEHCATGLMNWCVGNAKAEQRSNAIVITKQAAGSAKIDPLMATFDAASLLALNPQSATPQLIIF